MGHKINSIGFRLQSNRVWESKWFGNKKNYPILLHEDIIIRKFLAYFFKRKKIMLGRCYIKRFLNQIYIFNQILPLNVKLKTRILKKFHLPRLGYRRYRPKPSFVKKNQINKKKNRVRRVFCKLYRGEFVADIRAYILKHILFKHRTTINPNCGSLVKKKKVKKQLFFFISLLSLLKKKLYNYTKLYLLLNTKFSFNNSVLYTHYLQTNFIKTLSSLQNRPAIKTKLAVLLKIILNSSNSKLLNYLLIVFIKRIILVNLLIILKSKYNLIYLTQKLNNIQKI